MPLLTTQQARRQIAQEVSQARTELHIISAYCKDRGIEWIDSHIQHPLHNKKLLVRFLPGDIASGATDFTLYERCKTLGWQMYVSFDLHAKTYVFDQKRCIVGSANLTRKGIGIDVTGNFELSAAVSIEEGDMAKIDQMFLTALPMTDVLYEEMSKELNALANQASKKGALYWGDRIMGQYHRDIAALFSHEFPMLENCERWEDSTVCDALGLPFPADRKEICQALKWSRAYMWLKAEIIATPEHELYFGELSAKLHNVMVNDPKPYRKDIKYMLSSLLSMVEYLNIGELAIDRPGHSQRVFLIHSPGIT